MTVEDDMVVGRERYERRAAALQRQLERRIAEVDQLTAEVAALTAQLAGEGVVVHPSVVAPVMVQWQAKATEYDALMATKTMHVLRIPRALYGWLLARRAR